MIKINDFEVNEPFDFYVNGFYTDVNSKPITTFIDVILLDKTTGTSYQIQLERAKSSPNKAWAEDEVLKEAWASREISTLIQKPL